MEAQRAPVRADRFDRVRLIRGFDDGLERAGIEVRKGHAPHPNIGAALLGCGRISPTRETPRAVLRCRDGGKARVARCRQAPCLRLCGAAAQGRTHPLRVRARDSGKRLSEARRDRAHHGRRRDVPVERRHGRGRRLHRRARRGADAPIRIYRGGLRRAASARLDVPALGPRPEDAAIPEVRRLRSHRVLRSSVALGVSKGKCIGPIARKRFAVPAARASPHFSSSRQHVMPACVRHAEPIRSAGEGHRSRGDDTDRQGRDRRRGPRRGAACGPMVRARGQRHRKKRSS